MIHAPVHPRTPARPRKGTPAASPPAPGADLFAQWLHQASEAWTAQQMQSIETLEQAWLEGLEAVRHVQLDATHDAKTRHAQAHQRVSKAHSTEELVQAQGEVATADVQAMTQYWQRCATALSEAQMSWLAHANDALLAWLAHWPELMSLPQAPGHAPSSAMTWWTQAWQSMLPPPVFAAATPETSEAPAQPLWYAFAQPWGAIWPPHEAPAQVH